MTAYPTENEALPAALLAVLEECTKASDEARIAFPQVVAKLLEAGVERYHADLIRHEKTYYMPDGRSQVLACAPVAATPAADFASAQVEAAIRAIQHREIDYPAFCRRLAEAGCVGYVVTLAGRRAIYYGRTGDSYTEPFPAVH